LTTLPERVIAVSPIARGGAFCFGQLTGPSPFETDPCGPIPGVEQQPPLEPGTYAVTIVDNRPTPECFLFNSAVQSLRAACGSLPWTSQTFIVQADRATNVNTVLRPRIPPQMIDSPNNMNDDSDDGTTETDE
jgi:hypothetical protein